MTRVKSVVETEVTQEHDIYALVDKYLNHLRPDYSPKTVHNRQCILHPVFRSIGVTDIRKITPIDIDNYFLRRNSKPSTISSTKQVLRLFFQWCEEYLEIDLSFRPQVIKRKRVKPPKPTIFTREEIHRVANACKENQDRLMITLLFSTGIRVSELLNLKAEDITGTQIYVRGKGENDRVVHMPQRLAEEIREHCPKGYVFKPLQEHYSHPSDRYISAYAVRDRIQREFKQTLGIHMRIHDLRHSFAIAWLRAGGDIRTLQIMLGHSNMETTQWYLHLTDNNVGEIYAKVFS